ncbi:MAG: hypothetical protein LQ350_001341 [Teloschistes chrysophthalmus]|nr:MAG: hypothetical protein LQ350_001341 [Niorma chrysophthalma]
MARGNPNINKTSSIALALAGNTDSVKVPKPYESTLWHGKESFAAIVAKPVSTAKHTAGLPTPPNSISPSLPPRGYKGHVAVEPLTPPAGAALDSDLDLQDAVDHAKAQDQPQHALSMNRGLAGLADLDAAGTITPGLLAKHHLPGILLEHGPLAIRHVMGFLTTSVPGFSGIPPAKARRLVVGALELRGEDGSVEEGDKDVVFEKVGWGRWDARTRGQLPRDRRTEHTANGLHIPGASDRRDQSTKRFQRSSAGRGSVGFSHDSEMEYDHPDVDMLEHEADKMSLDGIDECSVSNPPGKKPVQLEDIGDATDEEDWASIGAAALRQASFPLTGGSRIFNNNLYPPCPEPKSRGRGAGRSRQVLAKSVPITSYKTTNHLQAYARPGAQHKDANPSAGPGGDIDISDREAVEALLKLGCM